MAAIIVFGIIGQAVLLIVLGFLSAEKIVDTLVKDSHQSKHQSVANLVHEFIHKNINSAKILAGAPSFSLKGPESLKTEQLMLSVLTETPGLDSVYVADETGYMLQARRYPKTAIRRVDAREDITLEQWDYKIDQGFEVSSKNRYLTEFSEIKNSEYNPLHREWFIQSVRDARPTLIGPYLFNSAKELGITYSIPVLRDVENPNIRVIAVDMTLSRLSKFLAEFNQQGYGSCAMVSQDGTVLAVSDSSGKLIHASSFEKNLIHEIMNFRKKSNDQFDFSKGGFKYEVQHGLTRRETPRGVS